MQAHVFISGFVQGVRYRYFVRSQAQKSGIRGFVQNLPDGRVEIVFQGNKQAIEKLITLCQTGPKVSQVQEVRTTWENVTTRFDEFEIR